VPAISRSSYRMPPLYRPMLAVLFTAFSLAAAFLWVDSATGSTGPGWLFTVAWTGVLAYLARVFLLQTVYELHLDGDDLSWKVPLRSGTVRLSDVRELRPTKGEPNSELIRLADGKALRVMMWKGFLPFAGTGETLLLTVGGKVASPGRWWLRAPGLIVWTLLGLAISAALRVPT
jgi:hypothetical protein